MINTLKNIRLYDDTGKYDPYHYVNEILYENENVILAKVNEPYFEDSLLEVLINKQTGEVLTENFQFWYAENY